MVARSPRVANGAGPCRAPGGVSTKESEESTPTSISTRRKQHHDRGGVDEDLHDPEEVGVLGDVEQNTPRLTFTSAVPRAACTAFLAKTKPTPSTLMGART